jgi:hypothetical protein
MRGCAYIAAAGEAVACLVMAALVAVIHVFFPPARSLAA